MTRRLKTGSRRGKQFGCGQGKPGCWCESIVLGREMLVELRTLADDGLCPSCLSGFARRGFGSAQQPPDAVGEQLDIAARLDEAGVA